MRPPAPHRTQAPQPRRFNIPSENQQRLKLWLASPNFYPTYGGAQSRYRGYIPGFIERGMNVNVYTGTPLASERSDADSDATWYQSPTGTRFAQEVLDGANLQRVRLPDTNDASRIRTYYENLLAICASETHDPLVVQMLTYVRPGAQPWLRKLKRQGAAAVFSISQFPNWQKKAFKRMLRTPSYRRLYNELDALVTNSEAIREFLLELGVATRIEYIPNGVDLDRFRPPSLHSGQNVSAISVRAQLGIPATHRVIAAVGSVMPRKGCALVIQAWRQLLQRHPDTHLLFVGPRADLHDAKLAEYSAGMAKDINDSGRAQQVHFTGVVDDVHNYLRASDMLVLASEREGTPNSVLEAMACGLPCVVTPFKGLSEAIGRPGEHYRMARRTPEALADALVTLLDDPMAARLQGDAGLSFVTHSANLTHTLDRYAQFYRELGEHALARRQG